MEKLCAFDLDGTLLRRSSVRRMFARLGGGNLARSPMGLGAFGAGLAKRAAGVWDYPEMFALSAKFLPPESDPIWAKEAQALWREMWDQGAGLNASVWKAWREAKEEGSACWIITAGYPPFAKAAAQALNADGWMASQMNPTIALWGPEKEKALIELKAKWNPKEVWAFGDSRGDHEMLSAADQGFWVKGESIVSWDLKIKGG